MPPGQLFHVMICGNQNRSARLGSRADDRIGRAFDQAALVKKDNLVAGFLEDSPYGNRHPLIKQQLHAAVRSP